jgi:spermidine synthase
MGFTFSVTQALMTRQLLVNYTGNELSIGLVLGSWLLLEAVGSGLLGRLAERTPLRPAAFAMLQVLLALLLLPSVYLAIAVRHLMGMIPGEGMSLSPMLLASFLVLIPLGLVDGAMFTIGCRVYTRLAGGPGDREAPAIGRVYIAEAVGGIVGGVVFTYLLVPYLQAVRIALVLIACNLVSAISLLGWQDRRYFLRLVPVSCLALLSIVLLLSPWGDAWQRWMVRQQWAGFFLVDSRDSAYGNVAVIEQAGQYTFFSNGMPILTAPVPDIANVEEIVHLPLLFHPHPRHVLVVSGGIGGVLHELLKYPLERVDYAELDPLLIETAQRFSTPLTQEELSDPRVHIEPVDGRLLVRQRALTGSTPYDLILVNLPYPSTLQLNRFYSTEFFRLTRQILTDDGILVLQAPGSLTYISPAMGNLNAMLAHSLREVYPYVRPIPGDTVLWLASPAEEITELPVETLVQRWEERDIPASMITDFHVRLKLDEERLTWFQQSLRQSEGMKVNHDLHPVGLLYGLAYWNEMFSPGSQWLFQVLERLNVVMLGGPSLALVLAFCVVRRWQPRLKRVTVPVAIAVTGFGGMAADLLIIFAVQALYGYVYHIIGLLLTAFMAGLSLGGWVMNRRLKSMHREKIWFVGGELALLAFWIVLPVALALLSSPSIPVALSAWLVIILLALNSLAGFLVGLEFPLANQIVLRTGATVGGTAGTLYAADLLGAFLGAMVVSIFLLPALGVVGTCVLMGVLKLSSLALVLTAGPL